jgi:transcription initiation factor TFIID subunit 5
VEGELSSLGSWRQVQCVADAVQPELDSLSFPLFAHTYLDLMHNNFTAAGKLVSMLRRLSQADRVARQFLDRDRPHHELVHATDVAQLASVTSKHMMKTNSFCQRLL